MDRNYFEISWGNKKNSITPDNIQDKIFHHNDKQAIFQHQIHDNLGLAITTNNIKQYKECLTHNSDYLITNIHNIGIGVLTADCLPIALIDKKNKAIGIVHAGWRGTVGKIIINAITHMNTAYETQIQHLEIHFGPCALPCCYEVDKKFVNKLPEWAKKSIRRLKKVAFEQKLYFDLPSCNKLLLHKIGIKSQQIDTTACKCTMCNDNFCSHRKNPAANSRQMSIIWLH